MSDLAVLRAAGQAFSQLFTTQYNQVTLRAHTDAVKAPTLHPLTHQVIHEVYLQLAAAAHDKKTVLFVEILGDMQCVARERLIVMKRCDFDLDFVDHAVGCMAAVGRPSVCNTQSETHPILHPSLLTTRLLPSGWHHPFI